MGMYEQKFTRLQSEIFRLFCIKTGESLSQRETAELLKVTPTAIWKAMPLLSDEGLIHIDKSKKRNLNLLKLNRENNDTISMKRVENLKMIYESGLAKILEEKFPSCAIILFGSYSLGEDTIKSDIDIAVIGSKSKQMELKKYETLLERVIIINTYRRFSEIHKNLRANIFKGILLSGSIEL